MILHGIYDNGNIRILDKDLPKIKTEVEIIIKDNPFHRDIKKVTIKNNILASDLIVRERNEK